MRARDAGWSFGTGAGRWVAVERREAGWPVLPLVAGLFAAGALLVAWLHLDRLPVTFCVFKMMTGLPCMTCGTTRALGRLAGADLAGALAVNPLATFVLLALVLYGAVDLALWSRGRRLRLSWPSRAKAALLVLGGAALLVNWAYLIWARV